MKEITNDEYRKLKRYDSLLRTYQKLLVKNVELQEDNLEKDKTIDHLQKLWKSQNRPR